MLGRESDAMPFNLECDASKEFTFNLIFNSNAIEILAIPHFVLFLPSDLSTSLSVFEVLGPVKMEQCGFWFQKQ